MARTPEQMREYQRQRRAKLKSDGGVSQAQAIAHAPEDATSWETDPRTVALRSLLDKCKASGLMPWEIDPRTQAQMTEIADLENRIDDLEMRLAGSPTDLKNIRQAEALSKGKTWRKLAEPGALLKGK